ncbi:MAG: glycerophosphodiester phosphodiesterase family protein [Bilifractor porci]|jgi:glycerophosphoryl diester phosphodiesterase
MGKHAKKVIGAVIGTAAAWAFAVKPRIFNKPDLSEIRKYDYANGGFSSPEKGIPENSIPAFRDAIAHGYGIRLDVRLTRDGVPVVFSDSLVARMCAANGSVENSTLEELKELRLEGTEETIPTLREALEFIDGQVPVILNILVEDQDYNAISDQVCDVADEYEGVFAIESLDPRVLRWFRKQRREFVRGQVIDYRHSTGGALKNLLWDFLCASLLMNFLTEPDYISSRPDQRYNPSLWICRCLYRVQRMNWTIRSMEAYEEAKTDGAVVVFEEIEP